MTMEKLAELRRSNELKEREVKALERANQIAERANSRRPPESVFQIFARWCGVPQ